MDLSIIVPVYNVEKYVRPCIESIFSQGLDEDRFEVIIVNDGSTDKSMEMIADIIQQHKNISVIHQENLSLSVARNNGIAAAKGEYILMPDSDDLLIENSLLPLLDKAIETKVDLVVANYLAMTSEEIEKSKGVNQDYPKSKEKTGHELFLEDLNPHQCYVWRTLYRRNFLFDNQISFVPGIYSQDVPFTHECYLKANKCLRTSWLLNIYRIHRHGAATASFSIEKARSYCLVIKHTWELRQIEGIPSTLLYKLEEDVYTTFRTMIYHTLHSIKKMSDRNFIMSFLNENVPYLNFTHGVRQRIETFIIKKLPQIYINTYYLYAKMIY